MENLPEAASKLLPGSPLELVVCQLVFAEPANIGAEGIGLRLRDALSLEDDSAQLDRLEAAALQLTIGGAGPPEIGTPAAREHGWRVTRGPLTVTVSTDALTIETTRYTDWAAFRGSLRRALDALHAHRGALPRAESRLGLRYVDRIERPDVEEVRDWTRWINRWVVGPLGHEQVRDEVLTFRQQVEFDAGRGFKTTLRTAIFPDPARRGRPVCVLDFDSYRLGYHPLAANEVLNAADCLHRISAKMFRAAITEDLYGELLR